MCFAVSLFRVSTISKSTFIDMPKLSSSERIKPTSVAIIGAGAVGSTIAYALAIKNVVADILLIDVNEKMEEGQVMDIADTTSLIETGSVRRGEFRDAGQADIIVVTAGAPQKPGETRLDLVQKNTQILRSIFSSIGSIKPSTIVILVANPVDVLTYATHQITKLPPSQIFGTGTALDTARLRAHVGRACGVSPQAVQGYVLGEHGDSEFVAWSTVYVGGKPIKEVSGMNAARLRKIEQTVKKEAYAIIERKGATHFGIGMVTTDIIEAIVYDQQQVLPLSTVPSSGFGTLCVSLSLPVVLGRSGIERHWPIRLTGLEKASLKQSAKTLNTYCVSV